MFGFKLRYCLIACVAMAAACSSSTDNMAPDGGSAAVACTPDPNSTAPTYTQLYTKFFAPGTPGHCATPGCHADQGHVIWLCGTSAAQCYQGMVGEGLINPNNPAASAIGSATASPIFWVNMSAPIPMPADASSTPNAAGKAAIQAWVANCAQNN